MFQWYVHSLSKMKLGARICMVVVITWGLFWTFFYLNSTSTNTHHRRSNYTLILHQISNTESHVQDQTNSESRQSDFHLRFVGKNETQTDSLTDNKPKIKVRLHNVQIAGNDSIPVHKHDEDVIPAEIRMTKEDNERHYFTLHKTRINPIEVDFIINGAQICGTRAQYMTLLILVPSLPSHSTVRDAIRSTYGSYVKQKFTIENSSVEVTVRLAFLVGKDDTINSDSIVREESKLHGDIIYVDFIEAYQNLTRKMLIALKWVSVYCSDLSFFLKIDEDVFINIPLLAWELHQRPYDITGSVYGYLYMQSQVYRSGKWAVTKDEFPMMQYPKYLAGNSYVISGNIIPRMFIISEYMPHMPIEDVFITGCIAKLVQAKHVFIPGFAYWHENEIGPCEFMRHKRISMTKVNVHKMFSLWNASINYHNICEVQLV